MKTIKQIGIALVICAFLGMIIFIILDKIVPSYCEGAFIIGIILVFISSLNFNNKNNESDNKTDKGIEWNYYKLSYRRRIIRTLWFTLFGIVLGIFVSAYCDRTVFIILYWILLIISSTFQIGINYISMKKEEK